MPEGLFPTERTLRDYQVEGLRWLRYNFTKGRGAILGDEMGLGKTAQSVTLLQCLRSLHGVSGPFLIVGPLSTLPHWQRELAEWTDLHSVIFHGNKAARQAIAMIKVVAPRIGCIVADRAIQIHGGAGVSQDTFLAQAYAGLRTLRLADGPDEVHLGMVGKLELKRALTRAGKL